MKKKVIVISPYSRKKNGKENAKNYPNWNKVIEYLKKDKIYHIIQIGEHELNEPRLNADEFKYGLSFKEIKKLVDDCNIWISVDNFFPHMCSHLNKPGIVIFGKSDPLIFGYPQNKNLLKNRRYLRFNQFDKWDNEPFDKEVFIGPKVVYNAVIQMVK